MCLHQQFLAEDFLHSENVIAVPYAYLKNDEMIGDYFLLLFFYLLPLESLECNLLGQVSRLFLRARS